VAEEGGGGLEKKEEEQRMGRKREWGDSRVSPPFFPFFLFFNSVNTHLAFFFLI